MSPEAISLSVSRVLLAGYSSQAVATKLRVSKKTLLGWSNGSRTPRERDLARVRGALETLPTAAGASA